MSATPARTANHARSSLDLALDVAAVLTRHGHPASTANADLTRLQQALLGLVYLKPDSSRPSTDPSRDDPATSTDPSRDDPATLTDPSRDDPATLTDPSRDDPATMTCPVCRTRFTPTGRQTYCSTPCRKTAFRRRHQHPPTTVVVPAARPRRQITVYECPACGERLLGDQRCQPCATFTRRVGIGGPCPHCDEPVCLTDLLDQEVLISHTGSLHKRPPQDPGNSVTGSVTPTSRST
jgi:hypothetical protein